MNRSARRSAGIKGKTPTYNLNPGQVKGIIKDEIDNAYNQGIKKGIDETVRMVMAAFVITLNEDFGFGRTRLHRALASVNTTFTAIAEDVVELDQLIVEAERCGAKIE
jgi:hypothetical protein